MGAIDTLDTLYLVLASPSQGLRTVVQKQPVGRALLLAVFISLVSSISAFRELSITLENFLGTPAGIGWELIPGVVFLYIISLLIWAGIFHLIATLLGGRGAYLGVVCGLSFAGLPSLFFAPLAFLSLLLGAPGTLLYFVASIVIPLWIVVLAILVLRYNYGFSTARAVATYLLPFIVLFGVIPFLATLLSLALIGV
jgi:hypothetical protein